MVYSAAGLPLYLPPRARDDQVTIEDAEFESLLHAEDGMQSLLNAIELDMNRSAVPSTTTSSESTTVTASSVQSASTNTSSVQSMVDPADHSAMMTDLLNTTFTNDSFMQSFLEAGSASSMDVMTKDDDFELMTLPSFSESFGFATSAASDEDAVGSDHGAFDRIWSGLSARWQDKSAREERIRQVITSHLAVIMNPYAELSSSTDDRMTRIKFAAPAAAQKSYGTERRRLVPFPTCTIEGAYKNLCGSQPKVFLSILPDTSTASGTIEEANVEENCQASGRIEEAKVDENGQAQFKTLHINRQIVGKAKSFNLKLKLARKGMIAASDVSLLEITTSAVALLSKPSAFSTRVTQPGTYIYLRSAVSLYSRLNSQTVRTRYLALEANKLNALPDKWTAFMLYEYRNGKIVHTGPTVPLMYGTIVVLCNARFNYTSPPMIVRPINGKGVVEEGDSIISQMHKVVLEEYRGQPAPQSRSFLTARHAHKTGASRHHQPEESFLTSFVTAETSETTTGSQDLQVQDAAQWTMVGLSLHQTSFIDALSDYDDIQSSILSHLANEDNRNVQGPAENGQGASKKRKLSKTDRPKTPVLTKRKPSLQSCNDAEKHNDNDRFKKLWARDDKPESQTSLITSTSTIQTPLSPLPRVVVHPVYLNSPPRIEIMVKDYWQTSSCLANSDIYLGPYGPCHITRLTQSPLLFTDATLEVQLPYQHHVNGEKYLPLLIVREDGIVVIMHYNVAIPESVTTT